MTIRKSIFMVPWMLPACFALAHLACHDPRSSQLPMDSGGTGPSGGATSEGGSSAGAQRGSGVGGPGVGCTPLEEASIQYYAEDGDLRRVLVARRADAELLEFRVFYGVPEGMRERQVENATRSLDGGTTTVVFDVDGVDAVLTYPSPLSAGQVAPTLNVSGETHQLTQLEDAGASGELEFVCLEGPD